MHLYEIHSLTLWLQPISIFLMNYRTNFVIFGMIHQHVIFFMECNFLSSGELYVDHTHNYLSDLFEYCFRWHSISLRECFLGSSSHQTEGTKSKESRG